jgi:glucose-6-phosphate 1-epimerase
MPEKPRPASIPITPGAPAPLVSLSDDNGRVIATLPAGDRVEVLLHGATVLSWKSSNGHENLWMSEKAVVDGSKAVRGGIPVVFPVSRSDAKPKDSRITHIEPDRPSVPPSPDTPPARCRSTASRGMCAGSI